MDHQRESTIHLIARGLYFVNNHPYAATGIFGAALGSAVTYKLLTFSESSRQILTPKVYEIALTKDDLAKLMLDPTAELRWESSNISVVMTAEQRQPLKQLPVIDVDPA